MGQKAVKAMEEQNQEKAMAEGVEEEEQNQEGVKAEKAMAKKAKAIQSPSTTAPYLS